MKTTCCISFEGALKDFDRMNLSSSTKTKSSKRDLSKSELGQFMTPPGIATFMAELLTFEALRKVHLLDAGAGRGALTGAVLEVLGSQEPREPSIEVTAFEIDADMAKLLGMTLSKYKDAKVTIHSGDYISLSGIHAPEQRFTHAILNPPYKKISSQSEYRKILRSVGIETSNLYSAFVALALRELQNRGELVAIIPRSFCNGPYFKSFRELLLDQASIKRLHLFKSRSDAFKEDKVLQENIIILLEKGATQGDVVVSTSDDSSFVDLIETSHPFEDIVNHLDLDRFINIPTGDAPASLDRALVTPAKLEDIGVSVSTGPVVGFRLKEHLRENWDKKSAPLIYPSHLKDHSVQWPLIDGKKPNAIHQNDETNRWLYPNGYYCVVKRFSSKEERHRIVASVVSPGIFPDSSYIGLDNKLNVFHIKKAGLSREMAHGLCAFLNTDIVDEEFRLFSGHTQVNATDLRRMKFPNALALEKLGAWVLAQDNPNQEAIYAQLMEADSNE